MTDSNNPGQFGNREDTQEQASEGGKASPSKFGSPQGADPKEAGRAGAEAQPTEAKAEGGRNSHRNA
ncbi:MAG TPA: hypothetical protein VLA88_04045 [Candidatus Saccharimonadales bacterium]|nr:hypothetical protein [Candidatus Saccharimonadales bacterium]